MLDVLVPETAMSQNRPSGGVPVLVWIHVGITLALHRHDHGSDDI